MERHLAAADSKRSVLLGKNLTDIHRQVDIEFSLGIFGFGNVLVERVWIDDVIDGRAAAGPQKSVVEVLANHDVVAADLGE